MKKITRFILILLSVILCLGSCGDNAPVKNTEPAVTTPPAPTSIILGADTDKEVVLLLSRSASSGVKKACDELIAAVEKNTGFKITKKDDKFVMSGDATVIYVGATNTGEGDALIASLKETQYAVQAQKNKLYIMGGCDGALVEGLKSFIAQQIEGKDKVEIPFTFTMKGKWDPVGVNDGKEKTGKGVITLNEKNTYQKIKYMGASGCWVGKVSDLLDEKKLSECMDLLYSEAGINMNSYRYNIGGGNPMSPYSPSIKDVATLETFAGSGKYSLGLDESAVTVLNMAIERGVEYVTLFINSPPAYMTHSGYTCGNTDGSCNLRKECYDDFVKYTVDIVELFIKNGYKVQYVSPINEPSWTWGDPSRLWQEGCHYEIADIFEIDLMVAKELEKRGIKDVKVSFPETAAWTAEHFTPQVAKWLKEDPTIIKYIDHFACHSYATSRADKVAFKSLWEKYGFGDIPLHQTEWCSEKEGIEGVLEISRVIHEDLTILECESWEFWVNMMIDQYSFIIVSGDGSYTINQRMWAMGNYSKFLAGSTRIEAKLDFDEKDVFGSAYINEEKGEIYLIVTNDTSSAQRIELSGYDDCDIKVWETSAENDLKDMGFVDGAFGYDIPAQSVNTFVISYK